MQTAVDQLLCAMAVESVYCACPCDIPLGQPSMASGSSSSIAEACGWLALQSPLDLRGACRGVLGDRTMTKRWGGSVLDSVIGAFLTQNASDVLSSKAWMTLQSRFPAACSEEQGQASNSYQDIVDWEAVRQAPAEEVLLTFCLGTAGLA